MKFLEEDLRFVDYAFSLWTEVLNWDKTLHCWDNAGKNALKLSDGNLEYSAKQ